MTKILPSPPANKQVPKVKQDYLPLGAPGGLCPPHPTHTRILTVILTPSGGESDKPKLQEVGVIRRACCVIILRGQVSSVA